MGTVKKAAFEEHDTIQKMTLPVIYEDNDSAVNLDYSSDSVRSDESLVVVVEREEEEGWSSNLQRSVSDVILTDR